MKSAGRLSFCLDYTIGRAILARESDSGLALVICAKNENGSRHFLAVFTVSQGIKKRETPPGISRYPQSVQLIEGGVFLLEIVEEIVGIQAFARDRADPLVRRADGGDGEHMPAGTVSGTVW